MHRRVLVDAAHPGHVAQLESWMKSYKPEELFDANGQPVFSKSTSSHYITLDVSSLAQGTYIVKVICCNYQGSSIVLKTKNISGTKPPKTVTEIVK